MTPRIGIAITTKNRPESYAKCMEQHLKFKPTNSSIFVVDDGSDPCYADYSIRNIYSKGISTAKNQCLKLMYEAGCDIFWLFDDDAWPLCDNWHVPYLESGQNHLCATFYRPLKIDKESGLKISALGNGYAMMYTRHCIETVGGFDTNYPNKFEHVDLSRRIKNAGLTSHKFQDVIGSDKLIYCLDQDNAIKRSFTDREMKDNLKAGQDYFNRQAGSKAYIEFRS